MSEEIIYPKYVKEKKSELLKIIQSSEANYDDLQTEVILNAFDLAAEIHVGETRKSDNSPFLSHPYGVAIDIIRLGADGVTIAAALLHDTVESYMPKVEQDWSLEDTGKLRDYGNIRSQSLELILNLYAESAPKAHLEKHTRHIEYMGKIINALTRMPGDHFGEFATQILELDEINRMRGLIIKLFDRGRNSNDTIGYTSKEKLKSAFKSIYIANAVKKYKIERMGLAERVKLRTEDISGYFERNSLSFNNVINYAERRRSHVKKREFLFKCMEEGILSLATNVYPVLDLVTNAQQDQTYRLPNGEGRKRRRVFFDLVRERYSYNKGKRFEMVTSPNEKSNFDGTILEWKGHLENKVEWKGEKFTPEKLYAHAIGFKKILVKLVQEPKYYVRGL